MATVGFAVATLGAVVEVGLAGVDEPVQPATETINTTTKMPMSVVKKRLSYLMFQLSLETCKIQRPKLNVCYLAQRSGISTTLELAIVSRSSWRVVKAADYFAFPSSRAFFALPRARALCRWVTMLTMSIACCFRFGSRAEINKVSWRDQVHPRARW